MSDKLLISTRKGLFTVARSPVGQWEIEDVDFLGDNVSLTLTDPRDGRTYAALDHGHFGVKLHRSTANGWEEISTPAYPPKPEGYGGTTCGAVPLTGVRRNLGAAAPPAASAQMRAVLQLMGRPHMSLSS